MQTQLLVVLIFGLIFFHENSEAPLGVEEFLIVVVLGSTLFVLVLLLNAGVKKAQAALRVVPPPTVPNPNPCNSLACIRVLKHLPP